ncbi:MAG: YbaK/EbsC family protein [Ignavibacteriales bacterium]|nr:YbaK/EbsC family protein [Ignavibacteriales bacterium]
MILKQLVDFLDTNDVKYVNITHSTAFTAQDVAESAHISGKEMAKTVIVWMDGAMAMVVLPAFSMVDFNKLKGAIGAKSIELASESEFKDRFPSCEIGAMPPFGNLFAMKVVVDAMLAEDKEFAFNAGTHHELIRMSYADYERLVKPTMASFAFQKK